MEKPELDIISSPETEKALLGCLMVFPEMIDQVVPILDVEDFYLDNNKEIYQAILKQRGNSELTYLSVAHELGARLQVIGGLYELTGYLDYASHRFESTEFARIITEKARARRIIDATHLAARELTAGASLGEVEHILHDLSDSPKTREATSISKHLKKLSQVLEEVVENRGKPKGIPTGYWDIDKKTGGFERGELTVLAGRPAQGKTSLAVGMAYKILDKGKSVYFASLEMTKMALIQRMSYNLARVEGQKFNTGDFSLGEVEKLKTAYGRICSLPMEIDETGGQSVDDIFANAKNLKPDMVIIDYLQLLAAPHKGMNLYEQVTENSLACKTMAKNLGVPVLLLSQLSRAPETRGKGKTKGKPIMSDLRQSGAIEQDADHIWMLYRAETYGIPDMENLAELIIAKNRNGPTGEVKMTFLKQFISFEGYFEEPL